jgi:hypothetical protein
MLKKSLENVGNFYFPCLILHGTSGIEKTFESKRLAYKRIGKKDASYIYLV